MSNFDIIRAWKDEDFGSSLNEAQRSQLPESPVGNMELLSDEEMEMLAGGLNLVIGQVNNNSSGQLNITANEDFGDCNIDYYNYF